MYQKNRAKVQPDASLTRAGDTWYMRATVSRFGGNMEGGHYVAACALPCGAFVMANDAVVYGPLTLDEACARLNPEQSLLIYARRRPPSA